MKKLFIRMLRGSWQIAAWLVFRLLPVRRNKIVVSSFYGRGYGDNPKYIVDALLQAKQDLRIIWLLKKGEDRTTLPEGVRGCRIHTVASIYHLSTAAVWLDNCRKGFILFKRKKQFYMQTWHGFALKRIERDVADKLDSGYVKRAILDAKHTDLMISDSTFMTNVYQNAFWYDGAIEEWGAPRNDLLLRETADASTRVKHYFDLKPHQKTVLYAPTFRADGSLDAYAIDPTRLCRACEARFGGEFVLLLRLHPNVAEQATSFSYNAFVKNASAYPDMQELLAACDAVVSDYSSLMFDFSLSYKPCFQFATDIEAYRRDRNFYFKLDQLPFPLATDHNELEQNILKFDEEAYRCALTEFYESVGMNRRGDASQQCAERILQHVSKRKTL